MSFLQLPTELHLEIGRFLSPRSRATLCCVNQRLHDIHTRPLYTEHLSYPLLWSTRDGRNDTLLLALQYGADVNDATAFGRTPFFRAAARGHLSTLKLLVERGADPTIYDCIKQAPILLAAENGHLQVVQYLLDLGADGSATNDYGRTPVGTAASQGHIEVVKLLLEYGDDKNGAMNHVRLTTFHAACVRNRLELAKVLYRDATDLIQTSEEGLPMLSAIIKNQSFDVLKWTFEADLQLELEQRDYRGRTPLLLAASKGYTEVVQLLLDRGAEVEAADRGGLTPLYWANQRDHHAVAELLLARGGQEPVLVGHGVLPQHPFA